MRWTRACDMGFWMGGDRGKDMRGKPRMSEQTTDSSKYRCINCSAYTTPLQDVNTDDGVGAVSGPPYSQFFCKSKTVFS